MITVVKTTVKEFFERKDEFMFPSSGDKFLYFKVRYHRPSYLDVIELTDGGKYRVSRDSEVTRFTRLMAITVINIYYERKELSNIVREKLETFEQLVARIAPKQSQTLVERYDTTGDRQQAFTTT